MPFQKKKMVGEKKETVKSLSQEILILKEQVKQIDPLKQKLLDILKVVENLKKRNDITEVASDKENQQDRIRCNKCEITFASKKKAKKHNLETHPQQIKCKNCDKVFKKNCELELHVRSQHERVNEFKCDVCDKCFVLKWRLLKHQHNHLEHGRKKCHYFNNGKICPFDDIGCMFAHEQSELCKYDAACRNNLCSFQHTYHGKDNQMSKNLIDEDIMDELEAGLKEDENLAYKEYVMEMEPSRFKTSTPKKEENECDDCADGSECVDCIVKRVLGKHGGVTTALCTSTPGRYELESPSCSASGCSDGANPSFS